MKVLIDIPEEEYKHLAYADHFKLRSYIESGEVVKAGHWRHYEGMLICSECGAEFYEDIMEYCGDDVPKYCPNCGSYNGGDAE